MEFGENTVKNRQTQVLSLLSQNDCRLILFAAVPLLACERRLISGRRFSPPEKVERSDAHRSVSSVGSNPSRTNT